jgi:citrate lyase subunit beta/citryl-CoA lyase
VATLMRSVLFIPGANEKLLAKALHIAADVVDFDLEDSVPLPDKPRARELVRGHLSAVGAGVQAYCRVNAWDTQLTDDDLDAVVHDGLRGVCLPKCSGPADVHRLDTRLGELERRRGLVPGTVAIQLLIESALGLVNAYESALASPRVGSLIFGALDYARDMGVGLGGEGADLSYPRAALAVAARAAGCLPIDHAFVDYVDAAGFEQSTLEGRRLGYAGRLLIHPSQIEPCHRVYSPSGEDVAWAEGVVAAFETEALPKGLAAISHQGKMADLATYESARGVLAVAATIREREQGPSRDT